MTVELKYYLQQFRIEQKDLFDENGRVYFNVRLGQAAEMMLRLVDMLEKELEEADEELEQLGCE
jgi:hypothetical protein